MRINNKRTEAYVVRCSLKRKSYSDVFVELDATLSSHTTDKASLEKFMLVSIGVVLNMDVCIYESICLS